MAAIVASMVWSFRVDDRRTQAARFLTPLVVSFRSEEAFDNLPLRVPLGKSLALAETGEWKYSAWVSQSWFTNVVSDEGECRTYTRFGRLELRIQVVLRGEHTNVLVLFSLPECGVKRETGDYSIDRFQELYAARTGRAFHVPPGSGTVLAP